MFCRNAGLFYSQKFGSLKLNGYIYIMKEIRTDLVKVSTYARQKNKSTTWVYDQAKSSAIKIVEIDGVKFVKV